MNIKQISFHKTQTKQKPNPLYKLPKLKRTKREEERSLVRGRETRKKESWEKGRESSKRWVRGERIGVRLQLRPSLKLFFIEISSPSHITHKGWELNSRAQLLQLQTHPLSSLHSKCMEHRSWNLGISLVARWSREVIGGFTRVTLLVEEPK